MKSVVVLSCSSAQCATLFWRERPEFYVGYRFIEHNPETLETPLPGINALPAGAFGQMPGPDRVLLQAEDGDPWEKGWSTSYVESDPEDGIQLSFKAFTDGSAWSRGLDNRGKQERMFFFEPVDDGVLMWMWLKTHVSIKGAIGVQQCLRYSGCTNVASRQTVACIPFLSEFDVQAQGKPHDTLTYARKNNAWVGFPLGWTAYHTPRNFPLLKGRSSGEVDHGLIIRESLDRTYTSGMYWERTAYISNRHPADCLHASIDFGPLDAGQSRTVHGKFYFIEGAKEDLLDVWRRDFPNHNMDR